MFIPFLSFVLKHAKLIKHKKVHNKDTEAKSKSKSKSKSKMSETITKSIDYFVSNFSGRQGEADYDATKLFGLHRRQRAYVWGRDRQLKLLDSILRGLYIPPIICNEYFINGVRRRDIMEGGNRSTTMSRILKGQVRELTETEQFTVRSYQIQIVLMDNLTPDVQREMFRRLNNSVKVSDGHLYAMSDDAPLVCEALAFLNDAAYPLRARITGVFFDTVNADNDGKANLSNAVAIVSGAMHGVEFITKSFARNESKVESQEPINRQKVISLIGDVISVFERADAEFPLDNKNKRKAQWSIGWALGAIMYDLTQNTANREQYIEKWKTWLVVVRRGENANAKEAIEIKGAQNINPDKLKRKSYRVQKFLETGELTTEEELKSIKHGSDDLDDTDEDDVYSDTNE